MGLRIKNYNILGVHWRIWVLGGWFLKNQFRRRGCLKREAWTVWGFKGRAWQERRRWCFWGEIDIPMHNMFAINWITLVWTAKRWNLIKIFAHQQDYSHCSEKFRAMKLITLVRMNFFSFIAPFQCDVTEQ